MVFPINFSFRINISGNTVFGQVTEMRTDILEKNSSYTKTSR